MLSPLSSLRLVVSRALRAMVRILRQLGMPVPSRRRARLLRLALTPGAASYSPASPTVAEQLAAQGFDPVWYVGRYPDVSASGLEPAMHYLRHGRPEGRHPTLAHARAAAWVQTFGEG